MAEKFTKEQILDELKKILTEELEIDEILSDCNEYLSVFYLFFFSF